MKIEYINKRPTYAKAVVSVVDHVECRCQPAPRTPVPRKKSSRKHHGHQHRNQTLSQEQGHEQVQYECYFTVSEYLKCPQEMFISHNPEMLRRIVMLGQLCLCLMCHHVSLGFKFEDACF